MTKRFVMMLPLLCCFSLAGCESPDKALTTEFDKMTESLPNEPTPSDDSTANTQPTEVPTTQESAKPEIAVATFGAGCFWCVEAVFLELKGVKTVESGYSGGSVENPSYELVCSGLSGHAEVCQITYDSAQISFAELLEVFWKTHDPTTLNRQGGDAGTQYRSVVFYHSDLQKELAEKYKQKLDDSGAWSNPIVTEISPFTKFYKAEEDHQNYFALNPNRGYCRAIIKPKLDKVREVFRDKLKDTSDEIPE